jgi:hypothetical protein
MGVTVISLAVSVTKMEKVAKKISKSVTSVVVEDINQPSGSTGIACITFAVSFSEGFRFSAPI